MKCNNADCKRCQIHGCRPIGYQPPEYQIKPHPIILPVYLGGKPGTDRIVITPTDNDKTKIEVHIFNEKECKWLVEYTKTVNIQYDDNFGVEVGYCEAINRNCAVVYHFNQNENNLTYYVIAKIRGKPFECIKRENIQHGRIWFEGGYLVEGSGLRCKAWISMYGYLHLVDFEIPKISGSVPIKFSISKIGNVLYNGKTKMNVPEGTIIQLQRTDSNPSMEKVTYNTQSYIKFIRERNAFKFLSQGKIKIFITPEIGCNTLEIEICST